jgi:hypothetical protein
MEKGKISRDEFMREIAQMTQVIVKRAKEYDNDTIPAITTPAHAVPELRRRGEGKLSPLRLHQVRILDEQNAGRPPV